MGCDIHLYVEEFRNGAWVSVDKWALDKYGSGRMTVNYDDRLYDDRNYNLFAILADVRNWRGFAGVKTGQGFNPIAPQRGLPSDCSAQVAAESENYGCDGHSHSWLTVREILDFDWNQKTLLCGWVQYDGFRDWRLGNGPTHYSGDIWGAMVRKVTVEEMEALVAQADKDNDRSALAHVYTHVEWTKYYHEVVGNFPLAIMRALHGAEPQNVRFVFWFDN